MQERQSVEELGVTLQKLALKAFPESGAKEFDRILKGRFYQALLPKWQRKLGAPKTDESFEDLYARARASERHEQQISSGRRDNLRGKSSTQEEASVRGDGLSDQRTSTVRDTSGAQRQKVASQESRSSRPGHTRTFRDDRRKSEGCFNCGDLGHHKRNCPKLSREAPGRSGCVSSLTAEKSTNQFRYYSMEELERELAERKAAAEQQQLEGGGSVDIVTVSSVGVKGPLLRVGVEIEGLPVQAVVDTGAQCSVISRHLLKLLGQHMRKQGKGLPKCVPPSVKLYGRGGQCGSELQITVEVPFQVSLDDHTAIAHVFVQPNSDIPCLLGMNVIPSLGIQVVRANGTLMLEAIEKCQSSTNRAVETSQPPDNPAVERSEHSESPARVYLIQPVRVPGRKGMVVEAQAELEGVSKYGHFLFEPDQESLAGLGLMSFDSLFTGRDTLTVPLENHLSVAVDLDRGCCIGTVTFVPEKELKSVNLPQEENTNQKAEVNQLTGTTREEAILERLGLQQGDLTKDQFHQLEELIRRNVDVFALDGSELGYTEVVQHHVNTGDHTPVKQQFRRIPFVHCDIVEKMVQDMTEQGVIRPSISPWASPVVLVPKKDGTKRFCVDYRRLNGITKKDVYPLPRIDDILDTLGGCRFFTSLDLASGYWQVGLDEESSPKSAFVTHCGLYEFTRMPFGMCNAPATFQRLMEVVLADLLWKECFAYIDDILVSS